MIALVGASCDENESDEVVEDVRPRADDEPRASRIETIEGVDLSRLERADRRVWVEQVNDLLSPCGEPIPLAQCATRERAQCPKCLPAARFLARLASEGADRAELRELYQARYGVDTTVEIDVSGAPVTGAAMGAEVTIVEFSDFECPHCQQAHPILKELLRQYEGRVRVIYKHYPLSGHEHAIPAAIAAVAAMRQEKFWEMHDLLFENQHALTPSDIEGYATRIGLDMERFRADIQSDEIRRFVERDKEQGRELGVQGTPSIFVNGRRFMEVPESLPAYVREELEAG